MAASVLLIRAGIVLLCLSVVSWSIWIYRTSRGTETLQRLAVSVLEGKIYDVAALQKAIKSSVDLKFEIEDSAQACQPNVQTPQTIIMTRLVENAFQDKDLGAFETGSHQLQQATRHLLECAPMHSYHWLLLYWLHNLREGFQPRHLAALHMSYETGRHEGWIAIKRNRLGWAAFSHLPESLRDEVVGEWIGLVRNRLYKAAAINYADFGWKYRDKILPPLLETPADRYQEFLRELKTLGLSFPELEPDSAQQRPWRR